MQRTAHLLGGFVRRSRSSRRQQHVIFFSSVKQQQQQHQQQQHQHQSNSASNSGKLFAIVTSCVALQLYNDRVHHVTTSTSAERQQQPSTNPSQKPTNEDIITNEKDTPSSTSRRHDHDDDDDDDNDGKFEPWYLRYSSQAIRRIRNPSLFPADSSDRINGDANNSHEPTSIFQRFSQPPLDNTTMFYDQCLERQLWKPKLPYPAWDYNWDGKMADHWSTPTVLSTSDGLRNASRTGTTRHLILVRHGQYHEDPLEDHKRSLTPLGRRQAQLTGKRLAEMVQGILLDTKGTATINSVTTSDMLRAKQTAYIIAKQMSIDIGIQDPDPDLNEGLPAPMIPSRPDILGATEEIDEQAARMDRAFRRYIHRADLPPVLVRALKAHTKQCTAAKSKGQQQQRQKQESENATTSSTSETIVSSISSTMKKDASSSLSSSSSVESQQHELLSIDNLSLPPPHHEFDIIVCHGNLIRYMLCRALQIPPEAWLRLSAFNCSISYIIIKPNGYVSCRMMGDIGHLGYKETTFSGAHGLAWS